MKRLLLGSLAAIAAAAILGALRRHRPMATTATEEIAPGVHHVGPWGRAQTNVYLLRAGSAWVLVDAGWASDAPRIEAAAGSVIGSGRRPAAIILTHAHPDHAGAARRLAEAWQCPVLVHPAELPLATGDFDAMARHAGPLDRWLILPLMRSVGRRRREALLEASSLAGVVRALEPGGAIPGLDGWTWVPTPGHTPGHIALVRADDGVVIAGDALLTLKVNSPTALVRPRQGLSGPPWYTTWDRDAAAATIRAIAALDVQILGSGHGVPMTGPRTSDAIRAFAAGAC